MNANEDADMARAIALSLQESTKPSGLEDEADEEEALFQAELQRALEASKAEGSQALNKNAPSEPSSRVPSVRPSSAFLSERAQLEQQRRERQKRLRPEIELDVGGESDEDESVVREPPAKRQRISSSGVHADGGRTKPIPSSYRQTSASCSTSSADTSTIDQLFWNGEFRQTATQHAVPRRDGKPTFRLTEVLGKKSDLSFAIMSSYAIDFSWIYEFFDRSVPVIMVAQPDEAGQASLKNVLPHWVKTTPILRGGRGCMHMKFMLLFYKTGRLRVVVSTANLIAYDYRDMENTIWLQDLPRCAKPVANNSKKKATEVEDFPAIFQRVLHSVNVGPALKTMIDDNHPDLPLKSIDDLRARWDWSKVRAHLIPSIAGRHEGWPSVVRTGHPRLMKAVRNMALRRSKGKGSKELVLECQGSSLGIYTTQWLNEFYWSARGESAEDWLDDSKKRREKLSYPPVKIVFPTKATVQQSKLGEQGGGTLFCRRKQWAAKNFPRDHFYDSRSKGGPVLMHSKMIIATFRDSSSLANGKQLDDSETEEGSDDDIQIIEPAIGWAYIGSHNFTPSAWGTLSGSSFNPVLNITNYELGVVFPLENEEEVNRVSCFERPPKKYIHGKDEPWIQEESIYHQDG